MSKYTFEEKLDAVQSYLEGTKVHIETIAK